MFGTAYHLFNWNGDFFVFTDESQILEKNFDILFILSYHKILSKNILKNNKHNIVIHASNLPKGKGFAPFFHQILENVGSFTTDKTFHLVGGVIQGASQLLVGCISFVYFLFYMKSIRQSFRTLLYQRHVKLYSYFSLLDCKMIRYVKGIGLLMFIQFVEYSFLFFLIGHPHWLVLGIFIGLFTAVPYVGGFVANTIAIVTAFMISKSLFYATLFVCFFFPVVDEYFISPKIYGKSNDIHPVITIFLLSIGGSVGGVLGIILSIPIYLFFRTTILFFQEDMKVHLINDGPTTIILDSEDL